MRLERLEINGFKSFSDRAELAFDQGVTAIVGPNGCGKSNVADAITWVLGEQSAKSLRGDRMEDVIFSGSDARKPGATAEVRLRLTGLPVPPKDETADSAGAAAVGHGPAEFRPAGANGNGHGSTGNGGGNGHSPSPGVIALSDGRALAGPSAFPDLAGEAIGARSVAELASFFTRDVEVTRRLYRSGESEYLIDGAVCRLRDVHDLLMDTGTRRQGLRHHRAGQDRHDPELAANGSASADRRSGGDHEVQIAAPCGGAEARGRAAEPHPHRRHRVRG